MAPVKKTKRPLQRTFLKEWRNHKGLDQEEAATRLDISRALLSKIENAKSPYSQRIIEMAAEIYECKTYDLIARSPDDPDNLWLLWLKADKTEGTQREQIIALVKVGLKEV